MKEKITLITHRDLSKNLTVIDGLLRDVADKVQDVPAAAVIVEHIDRDLEALRGMLDRFLHEEWGQTAAILRLDLRGCYHPEEVNSDSQTT